MTPWKSFGNHCFERAVILNGVAERAILVKDSGGWHLRLGNMTFNFRRYLLPDSDAKRRATRLIKAWYWEIC
jgi:hypothetical protein